VELKKEKVILNNIESGYVLAISVVAQQELIDYTV